MPVRKVKGGYQWGKSGKVYPTRAQAERQAKATAVFGLSVLILILMVSPLVAN